MSSITYLLGLIEELERESSNPIGYGQDFGSAVNPQHLHRWDNSHQMPEPGAQNMTGFPLSLSQIADRQLAKMGERKNSAVAAATAGSPIGKDGYQVCLDVSQFLPNELNVKVIDKCIVIEGKHEEREDHHGPITRHFLRRYTLPEDYDPAQVVSTLSSDGVLTVSVPSPQATDAATIERIVHIQQTGPAHLSIKYNTANTPEPADPVDAIIPTEQ